MLTKRRYKFEIFKDRNNEEFYFHLKAANGEIVLQSEGYKQKASAYNGIASVRRHSFHLKNFKKSRSKDKQYYFALRANNHEVIGMSEMYQRSAGRDHGISVIRGLAPTAPIIDLTVPQRRTRTETAEAGPPRLYLEFLRALDGAYWFRVKDVEHKTVLVSNLFSSREGRDLALDQLRQIGKNRDAYQNLRAENGKHYFVIRQRNGHILANSVYYSSAAKNDARTNMVIEEAGAVKLMRNLDHVPVDPQLPKRNQAAQHPLSAIF